VRLLHPFALPLAALIPFVACELPTAPSSNDGAGATINAGSTTATATQGGERRVSGQLTVEVLDVGQGDAILITTPKGKRALIDGSTGNSGESPMPYLQSRGVKSLDLVIATHPHADHIGGLDEVVKTLTVKLFTDSGLPHTTKSYESLMALVESRNVTYRAAIRGQSFSFDGGKIEVLHPSATPLTGTRSDLNSNSVVTRVSWGGACMLFTGDAEEPTEAALVAGGLGACDALKVAHHGSAHSSTPAFLAAVRPQLAMVSVGEGNDYGHPDADTLSRLQQAGAKVMRTDTQGTLTLTTDGVTLTLTPERGGAPVTVQARGAGAGVSSTAPGGETTAQSGLLNINTATAEQLAALPGLGEKTAAAVVAYRAAHGKFTSVADLDRVEGVGPATLSKLEGLVEAR
jgi:competence protein ComEC